MAILEENDLDHYMTSLVEMPFSNVGRTTYKRNQAKARRIIYDSVKENLMPVITPLKTTKECFDTLVRLYETKAPNQKRLLKNQLCALKMEKDESVNSFTKISQIKDQLLAIGISVDNDDLVQIVVDGLSPFWEAFLVAVNGRDVQPNFERLWHDYLQEEGRVQNINGPSQEENLALTTSTKKGKGKRFSRQKSKGRNFKGKQKLNMSKIKCYNCNKMGQYVRDCYSKKRKGRLHAFVVDANEEPQNKRAKESNDEQSAR